MNFRQATSAILLLTVFGSGARADEFALQTGLYDVGFSLELPHLERYAIDQKTTFCVHPAKRPGHMPLPVLSGNDAFANCSIKNVERNGASFKYDVVCAGRAAARATAAYTLAPGQFRGRIRIVLGAKNMTMTEVQVGRRIGSCRVAGDWQD